MSMRENFAKLYPKELKIQVKWIFLGKRKFLKFNPEDRKN